MFCSPSQPALQNAVLWPDEVLRDYVLTTKLETIFTLILDNLQGMPTVYPYCWAGRIVVEARMLCTGLLFTGILARVIAILGFDSRTILPTPLILNWDVVSFVVFWVGHNKFSCEIMLLINMYYQVCLRSAFLLITASISWALGVDITDRVDRRSRPSYTAGRASFKNTPNTSIRLGTKTRPVCSLSAKTGSDLTPRSRRWKSTRMTVPTELDASN